MEQMRQNAFTSACDLFMTSFHRIIQYSVDRAIRTRTSFDLHNLGASYTVVVRPEMFGEVRPPTTAQFAKTSAHSPAIVQESGTTTKEFAAADSTQELGDVINADLDDTIPVTEESFEVLEVPDDCCSRPPSRRRRRSC